jgi:DDE superfamily endonuclease/Helix-turn-helix of DDE superfamily endonuclease
MLIYAKLKRNPRKCVALTGLTPKEFEVLLPPFARAYAAQYPVEKTMTGKPRKRQAGGGRKGVLEETEQKLLFILVYQKTYPLQTLLGEVVELSQSRVNEWVHRLSPLLKMALDEVGVLPERDPQHFAQSEPQHGERPELIIDGTERRRQRPKNAEQQTAAYSGKKKTHCDKNVVLVQAKSKRVGFLSQTYAGKTHDKKIVDTEPIAYPPDTSLYKDTGFQGYEPAVARTYQPKKSLGSENSRRPRSERTEQSPGFGFGSNMRSRE